MKAIHHICIQTVDYEASKDFYVRALGFTVAQETPNFHTRAYNTWLQLGEFFIELQTPKVDEQFAAYDKHRQGIVHFCLWVDDLQQEVSRLRELGYTFLQKNNEDIYQVEGGLLCKLQAPEGTIIELRNIRGL